MTTTDPRAEYTAALRQLAAYLDTHADVRLPVHGSKFLLSMNSNGEVVAFAAEHGLTVVYDAEGNASCDLTFGPVIYHAYGYVDFDEHVARGAAAQAKSWAAQRGMIIVPADEAGVAS